MLGHAFNPSGQVEEAGEFLKIKTSLIYSVSYV